MESLTSCCHSSLQLACDTSPNWMCWVERIRGASGCWCLTWQSNTERGDFPAPESFTGRSYTQESQQCATSAAAAGGAVKVYQRLHLKSQRRKNAANDADIHTERSSKRTSLTLYLCADPLTPRKHQQINLNEQTAWPKQQLRILRATHSWVFVIYQVEHSKWQTARKSLQALEDTCGKMQRKKVISYQCVFLRMYTRQEHVQLSKVKLELRTYLCVIDLWLCVFGSYPPSFSGMQIRGTASTS